MTQPTGEHEGRADVELSVRAGRFSSRPRTPRRVPPWPCSGRGLLTAALGLADWRFHPGPRRRQVRRFRPEGAPLPPERLYAWLAEERTCRRHPLYLSLLPGSLAVPARRRWKSRWRRPIPFRSFGFRPATSTTSSCRVFAP